MKQHSLIALAQAKIKSYNPHESNLKKSLKITSPDFNLASYFDHTDLRPNLTSADILTLCSSAEKYAFYAVCVPPIFVDFARRNLKTNGPKVCSVAGFPLGYNLSSIKFDEALRLEQAGAQEIDFVAPIYAIKEGNWDAVIQEFKKMRSLKLPLKVIIESAYLEPIEIAAVCLAAIEAQIDFIKTSTGFADRGASLEDITLIRHVVQDLAKIKASGGIKTRNFALNLIAAGAERIGSSQSNKIIQET